jgi:hypothetical protein
MLLLVDDEAIFVAADPPRAGYLALWHPPAATATVLRPQIEREWRSDAIPVHDRPSV